MARRRNKSEERRLVQLRNLEEKPWRGHGHQYARLIGQKMPSPMPSGGDFAQKQAVSRREWDHYNGAIHQWQALVIEAFNAGRFALADEDVTDSARDVVRLSVIKGRDRVLFQMLKAEQVKNTMVSGVSVKVGQRLWHPGRRVYGTVARISRSRRTLDLETDKGLLKKVPVGELHHLSPVDLGARVQQDFKEAPRAVLHPHMAPARVILIGCGGSKREGLREARHLYTGPLFTDGRQYAEASGLMWGIVSAKYGLLKPNDMVKDYNLRCEALRGGKRSQWGRQVARSVRAWALSRFLVPPGRRQITVRGRPQSIRAFGEPLTVEIHAGACYVNAISPHLEAMGAVIDTPLKGKGQGQRRGWYKARRDEATLEGLATVLESELALLAEDLKQDANADTFLKLEGIFGGRHD